MINRRYAEEFRSEASKAGAGKGLQGQRGIREAWHIVQFFLNETKRDNLVSHFF